MENVEIKSGIADIISSGTVISFKGNPIEIIFGKPTQMKLILKFEDEKDKSELRVEMKGIERYLMEIIFFNFKDPSGGGNLEAIPIGHLDGRRLYLSYRIYPLKEADKTMHYTLYKGEEYVPK